MDPKAPQRGIYIPPARKSRWDDPKMRWGVIGVASLLVISGFGLALTLNLGGDGTAYVEVYLTDAAAGFDQIVLELIRVQVGDDKYGLPVEEDRFDILLHHGPEDPLLVAAGHVPAGQHFQVGFVFSGARAYLGDKAVELAVEKNVLEVASSNDLGLSGASALLVDLDMEQSVCVGSDGFVFCPKVQAVYFQDLNAKDPSGKKAGITKDGFKGPPTTGFTQTTKQDDTAPPRRDNPFGCTTLCDGGSGGGGGGNDPGPTEQDEPLFPGNPFTPPEQGHNCPWDDTGSPEAMLENAQCSPSDIHWYMYNYLASTSDTIIVEFLDPIFMDQADPVTDALDDLPPIPGPDDALNDHGIFVPGEATGAADPAMGAQTAAASAVAGATGSAGSEASQATSALGSSVAGAAAAANSEAAGPSSAAASIATDAASTPDGAAGGSAASQSGPTNMRVNNPFLTALGTATTGPYTGEAGQDAYEHCVWSASMANSVMAGFDLEGIDVLGVLCSAAMVLVSIDGPEDVETILGMAEDLLIHPNPPTASPMSVPDSLQVVNWLDLQGLTPGEAINLEGLTYTGKGQVILFADDSLDANHLALGYNAPNLPPETQKAVLANWQTPAIPCQVVETSPGLWVPQSRTDSCAATDKVASANPLKGVNTPQTGDSYKHMLRTMGVAMARPFTVPGLGIEGPIGVAPEAWAIGVSLGAATVQAGVKQQELPSQAGGGSVYTRVDTWTLAASFDYIYRRIALGDPVDIISISYGVDPAFWLPGNPVERVLDRLAARDLPIVISAGNYGGDGSGNRINGLCDSPRLNLVCVAALEIPPGGSKADARAASFSSRGSVNDGSTYKIDVSAPGVDVPVPVPASSGYVGTFDGTSAAAPFVSGTMALMKEANPDITGTQLAYCIKRTADQGIQPPTLPYRPSADATLPSVSAEVGHGLLNVQAAVACALEM